MIPTMGSREYEQPPRRLRLKPGEEQTLFDFPVSETPLLIALSIRELGAGFPGKLKIRLKSSEPFSRDLSEEREALLEAPGHYTITIENPEAFEQDIEVNTSLKRVTILRETKYILEKQLGRRTLLINIKGGKYIYKNIPFDVGDEMRVEFLKSLMLWSQLNHQGIPKLIEVNLNEDYYIAEYVSGLNLEEFRNEIKLRSAANIEYLRTILEITCKALEILEYANYQGIVHGDIKPGNIIYLEEGKNVSIIDWEICRNVNELSPLYLRGTSPLPEVVKDGKYSETSDIYSLGITLAYLLGWSGDTGTIIPRTLKGIDQRTLDQVSDLIRKMIAQNPSDRINHSNAIDFVNKILSNL